MPVDSVSHEPDHSESHKSDAQIKSVGSNLGMVSCLLGAIGLSIVGYTWFVPLIYPAETSPISCICFPTYFSVLGLIFGGSGFRDDEKRKLAVVGIILNLLLALYMIIFVIVVAAALKAV